MKSHIKLTKSGHTDRRAKAQVARKSLKDLLLLVYIIITFMGVYSAALFYAGTQYTANAQAAHTFTIHQSK